jgi:hypothetical protein
VLECVASRTGPGWEISSHARSGAARASQHGRGARRHGRGGREAPGPRSEASAAREGEAGPDRLGRPPPRAQARRGAASGHLPPCRRQAPGHLAAVASRARVVGCTGHRVRSGPVIPAARGSRLAACACARARDSCGHRRRSHWSACITVAARATVHEPFLNQNAHVRRTTILSVCGCTVVLLGSQVLIFWAKYGWTRTNNTKGFPLIPGEWP